MNNTGMKVKDLTSEWLDAIDAAGEDFQNPESPADHVDWKGIRADGYTHVSINGIVYTYCKYGIVERFNGDSA